MLNTAILRIHVKQVGHWPETDPIMHSMPVTSTFRSVYLKVRMGESLPLKLTNKSVSIQYTT